MHKKVDTTNYIHFNQFIKSASSIINFRHPFFVLKLITIDQGLLAIICKLLLQVQMYRKYTMFGVQQPMFMLLYALCLFHFL